MNTLFLHKTAWGVIFLSIFILIKSIIETIMISLKKVEKLEKTNILLKKNNNYTNIKLKNLMNTKNKYKKIIDNQQNNNLKLQNEFENFKLKCIADMAKNFLSLKNELHVESNKNFLNIQIDNDAHKNNCNEIITENYNTFLKNQNIFQHDIIFKHTENFEQLKTFCVERMNMVEEKINIHDNKLNIIMFESNLMVKIGNLGNQNQSEYLPFLTKSLTLSENGISMISDFNNFNIDNNYNNDFSKLINFSNHPFLETFILNGNINNNNKCNNLNKYFETMNHLKTVKINLKSDYKSYLDFSKNKKIELLEITDIELNDLLFELIKTFKNAITINLISCKYSNTELKKRVFQYCENKHTLKII
jgi:hypothetical protein